MKSHGWQKGMPSIVFSKSRAVAGVCERYDVSYPVRIGQPIVALEGTQLDVSVI
jgi:hypothetical protein